MRSIGRYIVQSELGRGSMGVVYLAEDPAIGRRVAIKTIRLSSLSDTVERDRLRERLVREAQSAGILSHPGIVTIYDISQEGDLAYVFMEYVNGPSLEKVLAGDQPPDKQTILSLLEQTASALDYAHKKGIVHRDIKPANILISDDGSAKITDFGVAKILSQQMTQAGTLMGTPSYMSPEQVQGQPVDGRADQFSLAVIAYEMIAGDRPFVAESLPTLLFKIVREEPSAPQRLNPSLSPKIELVLRKALAKEPAGRYPTCVEFVAALIQACRATPKWQPIAKGVSQSMPTVAGTDPSSISAKPQPVPGTGSVTLPPPQRRPHGAEAIAPESHLARNLLVTLLSLVVVAGLIWGGITFLSNREVRTVAQDNPPPKPAVTRPEPTPPKVEPPPQEEPVKPSPAGERVEEPRAEPRTEPPDTAPPEPAPRTVPRQVPRTPAGPQEVQLLTTPPGATVMLDNDPQKTCVAPCTMTLPPGRHMAVAALDGYRRWPKVVEVPGETAVTFNLVRMMGQLAVKTTPSGATVFIDGKEQTQKTPLMLTLPVGKYKVLVTKEGEGKAEDVVQIRDGGLQTLELSFSQR